MKSRYFIFLILLLAGIVQGIRFLDKGDYFSLEQNHRFISPTIKKEKTTLENYQKYLVFYSKNNSLSQEILENLEEVFKFNKTPYDKVEIGEDIDISLYQNFIFTTDTFLGFRKNVYLAMREKIKNEGGGIFLLTNSLYSPFHRFVGIENIDLKESYISNGISFSEKFYPGLDSLSIKDGSISGYTHSPKLSKDVKIIAKDKKEIPLIWKKELGKGEIFYVNTSLFAEKVGRGVMTQLISLGSPWYIGVTLNSKLVHLDDFPSPIPRYRDDIIYKSYGMDTHDFYNQIWWQDMKALARRRNLKYSAFMIGDYNDDISKSSMKELNRTTMRDLDKRGRELFLQGGELGIHGYNHNPLAFEGDIDFKSLNYNSWKNEEDIEAGLTKLDNTIKELWGDNIEIYSYVPPSNILTTRGKKVLYKHYPNLKIISSLFYGAGDGSFVTEVGRDRDFPSIYLLPRFSSGFSATEEKMWNIYNALAVYGYYSHFIHPDDILSEDRGYGKDWEQLLREFENMLEEVDKNLPYLEPTLNYELLEKYKNVENIEVYSKKIGNKIIIETKNFNFPFEITFRLKNNRIKNVSSNRIRVIGEYKNNTLYQLSIDREYFEIELEEGKYEK